MATKKKTLEDMLKGFEDIYDMSSLEKTMMINVYGLFTGRYQKYLLDISTHAYSGRKLKTLAKATAKEMIKASKLIEVFLGMKKREATNEEIELYKSMFQDIAAAVKVINIEVLKNTQLRTILDVMSEGELQSQMSSMESATELFAIRSREGIKRKGWFSRRKAGAEEKEPSMLSDVMGGLGEMKGGLSDTLPGASAQLGLTALLGPFAPLAMAAFTGGRGVARALKGRGRRSKVEGISGIDMKSAAQELGISTSSMRDVLKDRPSFGRSGKEDFMPSGRIDRGIFGGDATEKLMSGYLEQGMFLFFNKRAYQARWTKRVLEILGDRKGGGAAGRGFFGSIGDWIWTTLGLGKLSAGFMRLIKMIPGVGWALKRLGGIFKGMKLGLGRLLPWAGRLLGWIGLVILAIEAGVTVAKWLEAGAKERERRRKTFPVSKPMIEARAKELQIAYPSATPAAAKALAEEQLAREQHINVSSLRGGEIRKAPSKWSSMVGGMKHWGYENLPFVRGMMERSSREESLRRQPEDIERIMSELQSKQQESDKRNLADAVKEGMKETNKSMEKLSKEKDVTQITPVRNGNPDDTLNVAANGLDRE